MGVGGGSAVGEAVGVGDGVDVGIAVGEGATLTGLDDLVIKGSATAVVDLTSSTVGTAVGGGATVAVGVAVGTGLSPQAVRTMAMASRLTISFNIPLFLSACRMPSEYLPKMGSHALHCTNTAVREL